MPDIFLYAGEPTPMDIKLSDPTVVIPPPPAGTTPLMMLLGVGD